MLTLETVKFNVTDSLCDGCYKPVRVHLVPRVSLQHEASRSVCLSATLCQKLLSTKLCQVTLFLCFTGSTKEAILPLAAFVSRSFSYWAGLESASIILSLLTCQGVRGLDQYAVVGTQGLHCLCTLLRPLPGPCLCRRTAFPDPGKEGGSHIAPKKRSNKSNCASLPNPQRFVFFF